jgi:hypothetical protein
MEMEEKIVPDGVEAITPQCSQRISRKSNTQQLAHMFGKRMI